MKHLSTALLLAAAGLNFTLHGSPDPQPARALEAGATSPAPQQDPVRPAPGTRAPGTPAPGTVAPGPQATGPQAPGPQTPGARRPSQVPTLDLFGRPQRAERSTLEDRLRGGWILREMTIAGSDPRGRTAQGFANIGDHLISMEVHASWDASAATPGQRVEQDLHTSFTAEFVLGAGSTMECTTIIGSFLDEGTGTLTAERPGFKRRYKMDVRPGQLVLSYGQGTGPVSRLVFEPYLPRTRAPLDIFGRPTAPGGAGAALDIFGRPANAPVSGEVDMFGRPKPVTEDPPAAQTPPPAPRTGASGG